MQRESTIFLHQPVSEADSLFTGNFAAVSCSPATTKQIVNRAAMCKPREPV